MNRFFIDVPPKPDGTVVFAAEDYGHLNKVLRLRPGDRVTAVYGGTEYETELTRMAGGEAAGRILAELSPEREARARVTLVQGLPKGDKMETIIQKGTEIGAAAFWPVRAARSVVRLDPGRTVERIRRWQRVAREAAQQSGRVEIPEVRPLGDLAAVMTDIGRGRAADPSRILALIPFEGEPAVGMRRVLDEFSSAARPGGPISPEVYLVIGPEGGLEEAEIGAARQAGVIPVSLGPRIMRTETAGPAALAAVLYHFGDFGG